MRDRQALLWMVLVWAAVAGGAWGGLCYRVLDGNAAEINPRYTLERITPFVVEGVHAALHQPPLPVDYQPGGERHHHLPALHYPFLLETYWHALMDAGIGPLVTAPTGNETWMEMLDRLLRSEGTWRGVLRPDCVGLGCAHGRNPDGSLDRGAAAFNEWSSADVPDAVAFNLVLAVRQVARDWATPGGRWPGSWCGLDYPGGC